MVKRRWFEHVEQELRRRNVPRRQIARLLAEFGDHLAEIEAVAGSPLDEDAFCERLGQPALLAEAARENHLASSYAARHPWVAFLLLPIPATLFGWAVVAMGLIGLFRLADGVPWVASHVRSQSLDAWPTVVLCVLPLLELTFRVLPPLNATLLYCVWSERLGHSGAWRMMSCFLIATVSGLLVSSLTLPNVPGAGQWTIGFAFPGGRDQMLQFLVPVMAGLWWTHRSAVRVRESEIARSHGHADVA